jgi:hypothetical protein
MKFNNLIFLFIFLYSCIGSKVTTFESGIQTPISGLPNGLTITPAVGKNALKLTVNGSTCSVDSYINKPCVEITLCDSATGTKCEKITDILLDTGSFGLRVFKDAFTQLEPYDTSKIAKDFEFFSKSNGGVTGKLVQCARFGDGSADWGPVMKAQIVLGGEDPVLSPIQVIDRNFANYTEKCTNTADGSAPDENAAAAGFNGILGVGLYSEDCGSFCEIFNTTMYFNCDPADTSVPPQVSPCIITNALVASEQLKNPVSLLSVDNNGVIVQLPTVPQTGATSVEGNLILGIDTRTAASVGFVDNSAVAGIRTFTAAEENPGDNFAYFKTVYRGTTYSTSFLDTGSNGLYFDAPSSSVIPDCSSLSAPWFFCPESEMSLQAITKSADDSVSSLIKFKIIGLQDLFEPKRVFYNLGGDAGSEDGNNNPDPTISFDWGLPFFLGRNVYNGINGKTSTLGTGPYWAY